VNTLHHNGVIVPPRYKARGLTVKVKGQPTRLSDEQEEMAVAWAKKVGTPYVEDPKFAENFHEDFGKVLGMKLLPGDVDLSDIVKLVQREREEKLNLPPEVKKAQATERKAQRDANKEKYGYATVDGQRMELGNYNVEPNSIFMGRGQHPWRGKWKQGPQYGDIELNLSPDAPHPPGSWKAIVWEPKTMWIARWVDKLSGKKKYVWPGDASFLKQGKDMAKYEKARALKERLDEVKAHIESNLTTQDLKRRKTATVCYLIDRLKFRVGDEKDEDEADTVGASTLRPEHVCFNADGSVTFNFLGKDSVQMNITAQLPPKVVRNLRDFAAGAGKESLFEGINSGHVGDFLKEVMEGLSAKVFRTLYATDAVRGGLAKETVKPEDPDYVKRQAALRANLEAAIVCNHKRTIPKTWQQSLQAKKDRLKQLEAKASSDEKVMRAKLSEEERKYREKLAVADKKLDEAEQKLRQAEQQLGEAQKDPEKALPPLKKRVEAAKDAAREGRELSRRVKNDYVTVSLKLKKQLVERKRRDDEAVERMRLQVEAQEITRDYNLGTSLKNYVDPRIYYDWGKRVGFDWRSYYPTTLQKKFSWIEEQPEDEES
jgi:DNA topoisomerase I